MLSSLETETSLKRAPEASSARSQPKAQAQMSIKGMAHTGPYVVMASNFALGTTAADVESAMLPVGGEIVSCHLLSAKPTVMVEIVFVSKDGAENVIATFNNQKVPILGLARAKKALTITQADGKTLYVYMKQGGPSPRHITQEPAKPVEISTPQSSAIVDPPAPISTTSREAPPAEEDVMDVDEEHAPRYDTRREDPRRSQPRYEDRRPPNGVYEDGRRGFRGSYDRRGGRDYQQDRDSRPMYDDGMYRNQRGYRP